MKKSKDAITLRVKEKIKYIFKSWTVNTVGGTIPMQVVLGYKTTGAQHKPVGKPDWANKQHPPWFRPLTPDLRSSIRCFGQSVGYYWGATSKNLIFNAERGVQLNPAQVTQLLNGKVECQTQQLCSTAMGLPGQQTETNAVKWLDSSQVGTKIPVSIHNVMLFT